MCKGSVAAALCANVAYRISAALNNKYEEYRQKFTTFAKQLPIKITEFCEIHSRLYITSLAKMVVQCSVWLTDVCIVFGLADICLYSFRFGWQMYVQCPVWLTDVCTVFGLADICLYIVRSDWHMSVYCSVWLTNVCTVFGLADKCLYRTIQWQAWTYLQGSRSLRLPQFLDSRHMKMSAFTPTPLIHSWYSFLLQAESTPGP